MRKGLVRAGVVAAAAASVLGFATVPASADTNTGSISGTVQSLTAAPISGVTVLLVGDVTSPFFGTGPEIIATQTTGSSGTYSFTGLAASDASGYQVCFQTGGASASYQPECWNNEDWNGFAFPSGAGFVDLPGDPIAVTDGQAVTGVNGSLAKMAVLAGKVTDASNGHGLGNVSVQIASPNNLPVTATTAADGTWAAYVIGDANAKSVCFDASGATGGLPTGYLNQCYNNVPWPQGQSAPTGTKIFPQPGTVRSGVDAALATAGASISGKVNAGDTGVLLPGVKVTAYATSVRSNGQLAGTPAATTTTAGDGTYSLSVAGNGTTSYAVCFTTTLANESQYAPQCSVFQPFANAAPDKHGLTTLPKAATLYTPTAGQTVSGVNALLNPGSIAGVVTAKGGTPLAGINVVLLGATTGQIVLLTQSDANGKYSFIGLPQSSTAYYICYNSSGFDGTSENLAYVPQCYKKVTWIGHGPRAAGSIPVPVTAGATTKAINGVLNPVPAG